MIMAYWPRQGNDLSVVDYASRMSVGVIQYYIQHTVSFSTNVDRQINHVFAYVLWKEKHPNEDYFGVSATVCFDHFCLPSACSYLPVQRISSKCAHAIQPLTFNSVTENLFVACPLPFKYCI